jgi:hypothetical protein
MRKPRTQPAFATLTEDELDQVADWLRRETYETILDRIRKPRTEGGFALNISRSPLERLYAKVALLDLINSKVSADKKLTLAQFDSLWAGGGARVPRLVEGRAPEGSSQLAVQSSPPETSSSSLLATLPPVQNPDCSNNPSPDSDNFDHLTADAHRAILDTVHDLATSGDNTPTQLLALQRLADFPARAEIREHRLDLDRQKLTRKCEMDIFRKEVATAHLDLTKQNFAFRQKQHEERLTLAREKLASVV